MKFEKKYSALFAVLAIGVAASSALASPATPVSAVYPSDAGPYFTVSSTDLINQGQSTYLSESFTGTDTYGTGVGSLNDGLTNSNPAATDGTGGSLTPTAGSVATFTLDTSVNTLGYDITSIVSLTSFQSSRQGQAYTVAFSTVSAPLVFTPYETISEPSGDASQQVTLTDTTGTLATDVAAVQFTFAVDPSTGDEDVYREIDVFGSTVTVPEPASLSLLSLGGLAMLRRRARKA